MQRCIWNLVQSGVLKKRKVSLRNREAVSHPTSSPYRFPTQSKCILYSIIISIIVYSLSIHTVSSRYWSLVSRVATAQLNTKHPKNKWCKPILSLDQGLQPVQEPVSSVNLRSTYIIFDHLSKPFFQSRNLCNQGGEPFNIVATVQPPQYL